MKQEQLTPTELRRNLYRILDQVAESGEPVAVDRRGRRLTISAEPVRGRLNNLVAHDVVVGDPEELVHVDWSESWNRDGP